MKNTPSVEEQANYYDDWNMKYRSFKYEDLERTENDLYRTMGVVLKTMASLQLKQPKILEIGCGTGWLSEKLCEFGDVVGMDLAPQAIEIAKERGCGAQFIAMDFLKFEWKPADFDVVHGADGHTDQAGRLPGVQCPEQVCLRPTQRYFASVAWPITKLAAAQGADRPDREIFHHP